MTPAERPYTPETLADRWGCSANIEYRTLCYVSRATADEIIRAGSLRWLFGEPEDVP